MSSLALLLCIVPTMWGVTDDVARHRGGAASFRERRDVPVMVRRSQQQEGAVRRSAPRNADQKFLRDVADHLEAERVAAHAMMATPASHAMHGGARDPAEWDGAFDGQQRESVALLRHDYQEVFVPLAARAASRPAAAARTTEMGAGEMGGTDDSMQALASLMQQAVTMTNRSMPRLRRASTRDFARRVRKTHEELLVKLGRSESH